MPRRHSTAQHLPLRAPPSLPSLHSLLLTHRHATRSKHAVSLPSQHRQSRLLSLLSRFTSQRTFHRNASSRLRLSPATRVHPQPRFRGDLSRCFCCSGLIRRLVSQQWRDAHHHGLFAIPSHGTVPRRDFSLRGAVRALPQEDARFAHPVLYRGRLPGKREGRHYPLHGALQVHRVLRRPSPSERRDYAGEVAADYRWQS